MLGFLSTELFFITLMKMFSILLGVLVSTLTQALIPKTQDRQLFRNDIINGPIKFAVIADYWDLGDESRAVAEIVKGQDPDFIVTAGDNNYPKGARETIDDSIGTHYSQYIYPYHGKHKKPELKLNRFFPCLGNHDWDSENVTPYMEYFSFLNGLTYYDFVKGPVHFFILSSDQREPDGITQDSKQLLWLKNELAKATAIWKIVVFHHPPYSSEIIVPPIEKNNCYTKNRERRIFVPLGEWGADIVLNGHIHVYERFNIDGVPYIINGLGGGKIRYKFIDKTPQSEKRFADEHGALFVEADNKSLAFKFITISGRVVDQLELTNE